MATKAPSTPINPRTGRVWTLADAEIKGKVSQDRQAMAADPAKAREFLRDVGALTPTGKLARKYGG